ncbi:hypothetical protein PALU110988_30195 [Paenibacillus lupini]|uniref:hypothetical protein n=1 Tax=Paenibacillus lupini TaxID=1450204 RepID=UPI00141E4677|nr:hypothetical protein [Paenibacillus lupini]NIK21609.1 hypothetical protein [Paenibacillus lupini]
MRFMNRILIGMITICCIVSFKPDTEVLAHTDPQLEVMEKALLQQLRPVIVKSLREIYKESFQQYNCEQVLSINERFTTTKNKDKAIRVDAIHGGQYFEILVGICRPDGTRIEMLLKNDSVDAQFYLVTYRLK